MKNSFIMLKNCQKLTKMHENLQKPSKTVPKLVSRISYLVSRRSDLKKQTQSLCITAENAEYAEVKYVIHRISKKNMLRGPRDLCVS